MRVETTLAIRSGEFFRIDASAIHSQITRSRDGDEFARTLIPRLKIEYQPRRSLFVRAVGEYRSERQAALEDARTGEVLFVDGARSEPQRRKGLRLDWLVSYEPTPGTSVFFGYGTSMKDFAGGFERTNDGFFVKVAYVFRH